MTLRVIAGLDAPLRFEDPIEVWVPQTLDAALDALAQAERAMDRGHWIAGALSYEFGALLAGLEARERTLPLLLLGAFRAPARHRRAAPIPFRTAAPLPRVSRPAYAASIARILHAIAEGDVYQVNYTVPFDVPLAGNPEDLFAFLAERSGARYSALVEHGDVALVSLSPELFLNFDGRTLAAKPMKGTAPLSDIAQLHDAKNRAEHLMIVDLLRNDLGRICSDVSVERLFDVERYPTFATMTSTIRGTYPTGTSLESILRATFPCGSVTGAPKRAAMLQIAALEPQARDFYTGSIGFLSPQRRGWWNVAIRTLQFPRGAGGRLDVGGGIVSDSSPKAEWAEMLLKARFFEPAHRDFTLWETLRTGPAASDLDAHLDRLARSAATFDLPYDRAAVAADVRRYAGSATAHLVRIRCGSNGTTVSAETLEPVLEPVALTFSPLRVRSDDPFLAHKSAWRPAHEAAAAQARACKCFDAILRNERGEITEGSRTNIFVRIGEALYTPPLACGVLPGILRAQLVSNGTAVERVLVEADVRAADEVYVGNSARGLLRGRIHTSPND